MTQEEQWIWEKYNGQKCAPVFNESLDEIKNKYSWGEAFLADCARLHQGEPLAYIIGTIPFRNVTIHLDSHPLIPRTETEYWLGEILPRIRQHAETHDGVHVLDLCAGSGCIGVAVLKEVPVSRVDFAEIDEQHHTTIIKNVTGNDINISRTHIYSGSLFEQCTEKYDFILTNPPYIDTSLGRTEASVQAYEPALALYGGEKGLEIIERIIREAPHHLKNQGTLIIEHEPEQHTHIEHLGVQNGFSVTYHNDQYGVVRTSQLVLK